MCPQAPTMMTSDQVNHFLEQYKKCFLEHYKKFEKSPYVRTPKETNCLVENRDGEKKDQQLK